MKPWWIDRTVPSNFPKMTKRLASGTQTRWAARKRIVLARLTEPSAAAGIGRTVRQGLNRETQLDQWQRQITEPATGA